MPTIEEWYRGIPPVTRAWFTASLVCSILFTTGVPMTRYLPLDWDQVTGHFEVWRLLTCFVVFGGLSFNILITYYMMCQYVRALEVNHYPGIRGAAELLYVTAFGMVCILITSYFYPLLPSVSLLSFFIYIWSHSIPTSHPMTIPLSLPPPPPSDCPLVPPSLSSPAGLARIPTSRS